MAMACDNEENSELENMFLEAAATGEKKAMLMALDYLDLFDINCVDAEGRSALILAIRNRNLDIVEMLSTHRLVHLGDALLRAVNCQYTAEVRILCRSMQQRHLLPDGLYCRCSNGDIHPDITPPVLAAQRNNYDILKTLLEFGASIKEPSSYHFHSKEFTLEHSVGTIAVYEALISEAYISLTSKDPIGRAFELSGEMRTLSESNFEFRSFYETMGIRCETFAADLLGYVRNTDEQNTVLTHDYKVWCREDFRGDFKEPLKVKKAIKYDQKKFVGHSHCQQRLVEHWYHGLPGWRKLPTIKKSLNSFLMMLLFPVVSVCYIIAPEIPPGKLLNIPYVRFLFHMSSHICFLTLLAFHFVELTEESVTNIESMNHSNEAAIFNHMNKSGDHFIPTPCECVIIVFVVALTWKMVWSIITSGIHWLRENPRIILFDFITILLFWGWIGFRFFASIKFAYDLGVTLETMEDQTNMTYIDRNMTSYSPPLQGGNTTSTSYKADERILQEILLKLDLIVNKESELDAYLQELFEQSEMSSAEKLSRRHRRAVRIRPSSARDEERRVSVDGISAFTSLSEYHPLVLAECFLAVAKVFSFLKIVRMTVVNLNIGPMQISFGRMGGDIMKFMAIFIFVLVAFAVGLTELYHLYSSELHKECLNNDGNKSLCSVPFRNFSSSILALFWTLFGMVDLRSLDVAVTDHWLTEFMGYFLFGIYHIVAIVALLNILIAMMSNTYNRIEEDADLQWKYSRTNLWMCYYEESFALAPPFNLLPRLSRFTGYFTTNCEQRRELKRREINQMDTKYKELAKQLVHRYFFAKKTALLQQKDLTQEIWLMQMKNDVSGFRYNMLESLLSLNRNMSEVHHKIFLNDESKSENGGSYAKKYQSVEKDKPPVNKFADVMQEAIVAESRRKPILPVRPEIFGNPECSMFDCPRVTFNDFPFIDDDDDDKNEDEDDLETTSQTEEGAQCESPYTSITPLVTECNGLSFV
ncbi:short transient receptor potential channel 1-like [Glandiceps talaboti]